MAIVIVIIGYNDKDSIDNIDNDNDKNVIRHKCLFVWSQRECTAVRSSVVKDRRSWFSTLAIAITTSISTSTATATTTSNESTTSISISIATATATATSLNNNLVSKIKSDCNHDGDRGGNDNDNNNNKDDDHDDDHSHDDSIVFEKQLSKIWKAFPLWSADNTLLIDDSFALEMSFCNGGQRHLSTSLARTISACSTGTTARSTIFDEDEANGVILSDEENEERQAEFFRKLVHFWSHEPYASLLIVDCRSRRNSNSNSKNEFK